MRYSFLLLLFAVTVLGCGRFDNPDEKMDEGERIVVISKQYAEIMYALGATENLVAVDLSSTYPPEIKELPTVGYHRALAAEPILAMKPTLILHDNNIGPEPVVTQLEELEIPMRTFGHYGNTIAGTDSLIREMGAYFGKEAAADSLVRKLDADMERALAAAGQYTETPTVLIIHYGRASNVYLVMTENSTAARLLEWAGGKTAVAGEREMAQISPEVIAAADPDIILLTDFGYDRLDDGGEVVQLPGVSTTNAYRDGRVFRVEEHDMVYLGPRTGEVVLRLQQLIHPDAGR
ncbi:hemin ABC transporter substrate-binding protein [Lewinella sp. IMCC34183]|uniref:heme/hemin ABC transporter substrate-binding protein n=1 Tax=Lewinella sp. IMCC34183 TaxID=2248762 RepID=UPI000E27518D|nr:ABC transporter substrate-binding protein [Lewinella sp. IMCC34183]